MAKTLTEKITTPVEPAMKKALDNIAKREQVPATIIHRRAFRAYLATEAKK